MTEIEENNELIEDEELKVIGEDNESDEGAFIEYDISTYPSDYTLSVLHDMWKADDILIPDYQREYVWSIKQASLLIDSFLSGLPVPPLFFYIDDDNQNLVIDGQQRLLSIVYYIDGFFGEESKGRRKVFRLEGLHKQSPYYHKKFEDLDISLQRKLKNSVLRVMNIRQLGPLNDENTSVYHIFERLNTGGTPLRTQEIRNCVFRGAFIEALKRINENKNWRLVIGRPHIDKYQKDIEMILRIFALSNNHWQQYEKPMKEFLNKFMKKNQRTDISIMPDFAEKFHVTCTEILNHLGEKPFHIRGPLNISVLDSVFVTLFDNLDKIPSNLSERYTSLLDDDSFKKQTFASTQDKTVLNDRFILVYKYLIEQ